MSPKKNLTHEILVRFLYDTLNPYRKPEITVGSSASKMVYDDITEEKEFTVTQKEVETLYASIDAYTLDSAIIYDRHYFEIPLQVSKWSFRKPIKYNDYANDIQYEIGSPSRTYTILAADYVINNESELVKGEFYTEYPYIDSLKDIGTSLIDFISTTSELVTLKITSAKSRKRDEYIRLSVAMSYEVSFNGQYSCQPAFTFDELFSKPPLPQVDRSADNISYPRRVYNSSLVNHYSQALQGANPASKYLSFYHIIEHFFDEIAIEDAREALREALTKTGFSLDNKGHVDLVLSKIRDKLSLDSDNSLRGSKESNSILLTIRKFITPESLIDKLSIDEKEYYGGHKVPFADTPALDFNNDEVFHSLLSRRIYQTRNSIVHSKESNSSRYRPNQDRGALTRELPLVRAIAEIIIEATSERATL
ncbi:hypothetical protein [Deinococcus wulumuqiensis]|uniref:hypothetical protein n=1 Tax=Deinococcus wulumuqiensis TaxID=980427 RepID=UPI0013C2AB3A|nr:hypothetical protein [Deinococcus wulumuqiensis]